MAGQAAETGTVRTEDQELARIVRDVIAPLVAVDLGEIEWLGRDGAIAFVALRGACAGCPGQAYTLREVVLPALKTVDPGLDDVRAKFVPRVE